MNTVLDLGSLRIPAGADRGITENVEFEDAGEIVRDANGEAFVLRVPGGDKVKVSYSGRGAWAAPVFAHLRRGDPLYCALIQSWSVPFAAGQTSVTLPRVPVSEADVQVLRWDNTVVSDALWNLTGRVVTLVGQPAGGQIRFRPRVTLLLDKRSFDGDEWRAETNWRVDLIEK